MKFNFSFGKNKKTIFDWVKISILLETLIEFISKVLKIDKKKLWDIVDEIQREFLKRGWIDDTINDYVINTPELLDQRVVKDVDNAIVEYEKLEQQEPINMKNEIILKEIESDKFTETQKIILKQAEFYEKEPDGSKAQDILGGELGIRAPWIEK
jgi:uncharacterized membrane protein YukC